MDNNFINENSLGKDIIKGGVFFGSNLTPSGAFSNVPKYYSSDNIAATEPTVMLTLQKVKESIKAQIEAESGAVVEDDTTVEKFLYDFVNLLVDYRDLRNYVFYGSANTEIAYNIKYLIDNYPYKTLVAQKLGNFFIGINNIIVNNKEVTELVFPETYFFDDGSYERVIRDNYNKFSFFDTDSSVNWNDYELIDKNGRKYPITSVITPYKSQDIFKVISFDNVLVNPSVGLPYTTIQCTTDSAHNYEENQVIQFADLSCADGISPMQFKVGIQNGLSYSFYNYNLNQATFYVTNVTSNTFNLRRINSNSSYENIEIEDYGIVDFYDSTNPGIVRKFPLDQNQRPYNIKIVVSGNFVAESMIAYTEGEDSFVGFVISPKQSILDDFDYKTTPIQKMLLSPSPINPTPWPRRIVTNNIQNIVEGSDVEPLLIDWLQNPNALYIDDKGFNDDISYGKDLYFEYRLTRALSLDESYSNQLIRRCIPPDIISELNDTDDYYYQRFILIAGWFFDQIRLYIKFIKYVHTINHSDFNQLSPEYYQYYASHYGFDLFSDDSIDFTQLVIKTEKGFYFNDTDQDNKYYRLTLQKLQYERQKRLLLSLFYLYKIKGTQACINKLVSLLGAPDGFLALNEYVFNVDNKTSLGYPDGSYVGSRLVDNEKVKVPNVFFEIDPDYLKDKTNINNPINKPYYYRAVYDNEYTHNLREISINTDPNGAIDNHILSQYGQQRYNYIKFNKNEFSTLQKNGDFFLLPLSLPDRFYGFTFEYMIPTNGFIKGVGNNTEEATLDVFSLYNISMANFKPILAIAGIAINEDYTTAIVSTDGDHGYAVGENILINGSIGVNGINNILFQVSSILDASTFTVIGDFSGEYVSGGTVNSGELTKFSSTEDMMYTYPIAVKYQNRNRDIDFSLALDSNNVNIPGVYSNPDTDFNILKSKFPDSVYLDENSYIITRLEGKDLVVRLRIKSEVDGQYGERCAIFDNVFSADGLNHEVRLLLRQEGIEVYQDYYFKGVAKWLNISDAGSYKAYEIPKSVIKLLRDESENCINHYDPIINQDFISVPDVYNTQNDRINFWDLFIGMPDGVDFYFKRLNFFENTAVNDFNIADKIINDKNYTSEFYLFEVVNPVKFDTKEQSIVNFEIPAVFYKKFPNVLPEFYGYVLPQTLDIYNRVIITDLNLRRVKLNTENKYNLFLNKMQNFFKSDDVFASNAWQKDIHKVYNYDNFGGEVIDLYSIYSPQVLTYDSLAEFLNLIEGKFRNVIQQFIPIVINISDFGRIIKNSIFSQAKNRIKDNDKVCKGAYTNVNSFFSDYIFRKDKFDLTHANREENIFFSIKIDGADIIAPTEIVWNIDETLVLLDIKDYINTSEFGSAGNIIADVYGGMLRVVIDYEWFYNTYGKDANDCKFEIIQGPVEYFYDFNYGNFSNNDAIPEVSNSCGDVVSFSTKDRDECAGIQYSLPSINQPTVYVYFDSENKKAIYPRFASEIVGDVIFLHKSTE